MATKGVSVGVEITGSAKGFKSASEDAARATEQLKRKVEGHNKSITNSFKALAGVIGVTFTVSKLVDFSKELINITARAEGIRTAFRQLNQPDLLRNLQKATRGTVDNVLLMQKAVQADNFKIPLEQLALYFEFATSRAIQTGQSVNFLVSSIIDGVGRKSSLVLDNLGISLTEIQDEFKRTGNYAEAVGNIIKRSLGESGEVASTLQTKLEQSSTIWANFKLNLGTAIVSSTWVQNLLAALDKIQSKLQDFSTEPPKSEPKPKPLNPYEGFSEEKLKKEAKAINDAMDVQATAMNIHQRKIDKYHEEWDNKWNWPWRLKETVQDEEAFREDEKRLKIINGLYDKNQIKLNQIKVAQTELTTAKEAAAVAEEAATTATTANISTTEVEKETLEGLNEQLKEQELYLSKLNIQNTIGIRIQYKAIQTTKDRIAAILKLSNAENEVPSRPSLDPFRKENFDYNALIPLVSLGTQEDIQRSVEAVNAQIDGQIQLVTSLSYAFEGLGNAIAQASQDGQISFAESMNIIKETALSVIDVLAGLAAANMIAKEAQKGLVGIFTAITGVATIMALFASFASPKKMADGGVVYGPTLANVGEYANASTNPEVVAPLSKLKGMLGGDTINVKVTGKLQGKDIYLSAERYSKLLNKAT